MKKLLYACLFIYFIYIIFFYQNMIILTSNILNTFINKVIPSLCFFLFLSQIIISSNILLKIIYKFKVIKEPLLIALCFLLGSPASSTLFKELEEKKLLSKNEKENYISSFSGISFSFLLGLLEKNIHIIYVIFCAELIVFLFFKEREKNSFNDVKLSLNKKIIMSSIKKTSFTLIFIFLSTLFFNSFFLINLDIFVSNPFLTYLNEFSYSAYLINDINIMYKEYFQIFLLSFTSMSLFFQIIFFDRNYDILKHIKRRLMIAILSCLLSILIL